jgi:hypothetical protein
MQHDLDQRGRRSRCAAVGRETCQKLSARYRFGSTLQESEFSFSLKKSSQCVYGTDPNLTSWCADRNDVPPSVLGKSGAGPAVARQGSRCARLAPPADGPDWRPLALRLMAMRRWLGASDMPLPLRRINLRRSQDGV